MVLDLDAQNSLVSVEMPVPTFEPADIPLNVAERQNTYQLTVNNQKIDYSALSVGNPHAVIQVPEIETADVELLGPLLESHVAFPERANIGFMQIINRQEFSLRVYERGTGETIACGSGACAAAIAGIQLGELDKTVTAHLRGGDLQLSWEGEGQPILMTGPAVSVFDGIIDL